MLTPRHAYNALLQHLRSLGNGVMLVLPLSVTIGALVAFFLRSLDWVTNLRWQNPLWIAVMPIVGVGIVWMYKKWGKNASAGNNLIIDEIHQPGGGIPLRMTPFILVSTLATHLTGGSAGREGTAVQMGGSMAAWFARRYKLHHDKKRVLLIAGMAAGFSAVFGTPIAGTIFALEVLAIGKIRYQAMMPALLAAIIGHYTCLFLGAIHTPYYLQSFGPLFAHGITDSTSWKLIGAISIAGISFGFVAYLFSWTESTIKALGNRYIRNDYLKPVIASAFVIGVSLLLGTNDYLGLGVHTQDGTGTSIVNAFQVGGATSFSWFWKLLLTAVTLGLGFKGGEVTPLFFIGATLGNTLAILMGVPIDLMAALGFVAVFAGATNTPLACTILGAEIFGTEYWVLFAIVNFLAYICSGQGSIYASQRNSLSKIAYTHDS